MRYSKGYVLKHAVLSALSAILCMMTVQSQTKHEVHVMMTDSVLLDATYYVPQDTSPGGMPAIIFIHGFAMSKDETDASARIYAQIGYVTFTYSVRGHGNSGGLSTIMASREREDLAAIVGYVRSLPQVDPRNVGITGGSQGGLHGLWAVTDRLPVKAVTADVIGPHWASDMLANGAYRSTLLYLISANTVRFDSIRDTLYRALIDDEYDTFYSTFVTPRDIDGHDFSIARTPLMLFGKWQDHYFRANEGIQAYSEYRAHRDYQKLYVGTGGHYSDDDPAQWNFQFSWITRWFDQLLRGNNSGILAEPDIAYAYSSLPMNSNGYFTWNDRTLDTWPPSGASPVKLYLSASGSLRISPPSEPNASQMLLNDYRDSTYTMYWAFWDDLQGEWFDSSFRQQSLVFQSSPLTEDGDWVGVPSMHLYVQSGAEKFPINAQIYEVDSSGNKFFVNRINYVGRNNTPGSFRVIDADGNAHAHRFKAGNSIRIELTNLDKTNRKLLGDYPFVVPVFKRSETLILMDAAHPSYIGLPMLSIPLSAGGDQVDKPLDFELSQNYPNPFNPSTEFQFTIAEFGFVSLKVYDVLGKEVATIVNAELPPGRYARKMNAAALSSGVYFYELTSGRYISVRKMVLAR